MIKIEIKANKYTHTYIWWNKKLPRGSDWENSLLNQFARVCQTDTMSATANILKSEDDCVVNTIVKKILSVLRRDDR